MSVVVLGCRNRADPTPEPEPAAAPVVPDARIEVLPGVRGLGLTPDEELRLSRVLQPGPCQPLFRRLMVLARCDGMPLAERTEMARALLGLLEGFPRDRFSGSDTGLPDMPDPCSDAASIAALDFPGCGKVVEQPTVPAEEPPPPP